ncbi:16016_t:CDS:2 [Cetraspora pellucida]|uniref:16016_t:CDS:1 n=1 Tax=Cetraspora pellucida TaxID=1433469 RepID=A0A9N9IYD9_9GLOM|nr:16016_t:CDS:2 [Cetraspora pellucida]
MLECVESEQPTDELKINILQAIQINTDLQNNISQTIDLALDNLTNALEALHTHFTYSMPVDEFLSISKEDIVYKVPNNDQIIEELIDTFRPVDLTDDDLEVEEDSIKIPIISADIVIESLEIVCMFLLQQDTADEYIKTIKKVEKFIK